jgi:hypothetical protein
MKLYLFTPVDKTFRKEFYYIIRKQNLKIAGLVSFITAIAAFVVRIIANLLPQTHALPPQQFHELSLQTSA